MKLTVIALTALFCASVAFAQDEAPASSPATSPAASPTPDKGKTSEARFRKFDTDKDNFLSVEEFNKGAKDFEKNAEIFKKRDADGDGKLSLEEYLTAKN